MRFKLLAGRHYAGQGKETVAYQRGDIIETDKDLVSLFGDKFEQIPEAGAVDTLDTMTVQELRRLADQNEVDLGEATKKQDIIRLLRATSTGA